MKSGVKKVGAGWTLGSGAVLLGPAVLGVSTIAVIGITVGLILAAVVLGIGKWFTVGSVLGVGLMLLLKPLLITAITVTVITIVIIGLTWMWLGSEAASPTSQR